MFCVRLSDFLLKRSHIIVTGKKELYITMDTTRQHILGRVVGVTSTLFLLYLLAIALLSSSGARAALPASSPTGAIVQPQVPFEATPTPTATPVDTDTPTPVDTDTPTVMPTDTPASTPVACTISFEDVPVGSTFYPYIQCMA